MKRFSALMLASAFAGTTTHAFAQSETVLIQPSLPDDFDKGRNVSVMQRARPDYDSIGIRTGSFNFFPEVTVAAGYSSNIYYSGTNEQDSAYVLVAPSFRLQSDWSRHEVKVQGGLQAQRFLGNSTRNQTPWNLAGLAALDIGPSFRLTPEVQVSRQFENAFTGATSSDTAVLSSYFRAYGGLRGEYSAGQSKLTVSTDYTTYDFADVKLRTGTIIDQGDRDRNAFRVTAQGQYALTPSAAVYLQGQYVDTDYDNRLFNGDPNRDSKGYRILGGLNFDLAGLMRGTVGVGYAKRNFRSPLYRNVSGLSLEGKLEYFPSELTTITVAARRVLEDSSIGTNSAFFDNRALMQVDHELLQNLIVSGFGEFSRQNYLDSPLKADIYRIGSSADYLASPSMRFNARLAYTHRSVNQQALGNDFNEVLGQIGVTFKR